MFKVKEKIVNYWEKEFDEIFSLTEDLVSNGAIINKLCFKESLKGFITQLITKAEEREREKISKILSLISAEIATANIEDDKTSRLTSLYNKVFELNNKHYV